MTEPVARDDAALATAVAAGDVGALGEIYDRYAPRLLGFCRSMLHRQAEAEDCLQDVFVIAATRLGGLREPELLRSWLFSVARHECLARLDRRRREVLVDEVFDRPSDETDPAVTDGMDVELAALLRDAQAGMSDRDRLLLELADRQQLAGDDFAAAIGVSRATAYTLLARARTTAKKSIGALLVARTGRERCPELNTLLGQWDGELTPLLRKQLARHIEKCSICDNQRSRVASMAALLGGEGEAFAARLVSLRRRILDAAAAAMGGATMGAAAGAAAMGAAAPAAFATGGWPPADPVFAAAESHRRRRRLAAVLVIAIIVLLGGIIGAGAIGPLHKSSNGTPTVPTGTTPPPGPTASPIVNVSSSGGAASISLSIAPSSGSSQASHGKQHTHSASPSALRSSSAGSSTSAAPSTSARATSPHPSHHPSSTHPNKTGHPTHKPTPTPTKTKPSPSKSKTSSPPSSSPPSTTSPPPPPVWVLTVQPEVLPITVTWGGNSESCPGGGAAAPPPCSYKIDDGTSVTINITDRYRYYTPPDCTSSTTGLCTITMKANESVTIHTT
jgi:RNA polymerase sigma factor (sigma-70 family)